MTQGTVKWFKAVSLCRWAILAQRLDTFGRQ
jgi:hypothetical protein